VYKFDINLPLAYLKEIAKENLLECENALQKEDQKQSQLRVEQERERQIPLLKEEFLILLTVYLEIEFGFKNLNKIIRTLKTRLSPTIWEPLLKGNSLFRSNH
jgi:hypothetical protein